MGMILRRTFRLLEFELHVNLFWHGTDGIYMVKMRFTDHKVLVFLLMQLLLKMNLLWMEFAVKLNINSLLKLYNFC